MTRENNKVEANTLNLYILIQYCKYIRVSIKTQDQKEVFTFANSYYWRKIEA